MLKRTLEKMNNEKKNYMKKINAVYIYYAT